MRKLAKAESVSTATMWRVCHVDLGLKPYKNQQCQVLSAASKTKQLERSRHWLKNLKDSTSPVFWTDKLFTIQAVHNHQNDQVLGPNKEALGIKVLSHFWHQIPAAVMCWAGVTTDAQKTPLVFIEESMKVGSKVYLHLLSEEVLPWIKAEYTGASVLFQQDGAPAHKANIVQSFCSDMFSHFWKKKEWPPSSPDLNVMDYSM